MGVEKKTKKKKDEMNVKKQKGKRRRLPRLYPHTLSQSSSSIEEEGTFRVPRLTLCSALKVNSSLSSLESDGRLVAEGSLALYRNFTISRQGFSITLGRPNIFSFIYRKDIDARHSRDTHTRVCFSPAGVQKKRMQIKQSVFLHHSKWEIFSNDWNIFLGVWLVEPTH